ncbi:trypco2 family protein [[Kitasatospora] papulosa]|uniref:trypco2 family protein n=1 Tax=Streptomyces TaxID=1883 RepID=UPI002FEF10DA
MIELPVMIRELRRALTEAMADGDGEAIRFDLGPIDIETSVTVTKEANGSAKVKFWVAEAGGGAKLSQSDVQRITLSLQPRLAGTDRAPRISGGSVPGER